MSPKGICPICEASIIVDGDIEESEIMSCSDCLTMLVVESIENDSLHLTQAPEIEEDWGE